MGNNSLVSSLRDKAKDRTAREIKEATALRAMVRPYSEGFICLYADYKLA